MKAVRRDDIEHFMHDVANGKTAAGRRPSHVDYRSYVEAVVSLAAPSDCSARFSPTP